MVPTHPILQYMSFDRFFLLQRHIRISDSNSISCGLPAPFAQVNEWAEHIQQSSLALCQLGTCLAVDECMVGYTGRSKQTVTVKNKPTPTGFKVWVVAQAGYFVRWLWHQPSNALGPAAGKKRKRATGTAEGGISLNPTQSVVVALVKQLPEQTYHVFFDNLFSSPNLFTALRQLGIGATGTARVNCGFYQPFVEAKKADTKGECWPWGMLKTAPTPDGQSIPARNSKSEFGVGRQQRIPEHDPYSKSSVPSPSYVFPCRRSLQTTMIKWAALILETN
ncbi:hypothetical protein HIM_10452 [Hirsutella minnesotensis 3608]|uniref:PiggyBac transposable element-derived protein domain-containing protein n=1 Tax=Hirsutella minnesotensis 3608 TaxID=1043627 RepID=A0A0F7ZK27_9HYPO|nr:hypothetical protein HIM_10452 [Hirsutella minnesotensis 3608]